MNLIEWYTHEMDTRMLLEGCSINYKGCGYPAEVGRFGMNVHIRFVTPDGVQNLKVDITDVEHLSKNLYYVYDKTSMPLGILVIPEHTEDSDEHEDNH